MINSPVHSAVRQRSHSLVHGLINYTLFDTIWALIVPLQPIFTLRWLLQTGICGKGTAKSCSADVWRP